MIEVTEVWHMAHFWMSYGRCVIPGLPMGQSVTVAVISNYMRQERNTKRHATLHASGSLMAVLPC